MKNWLKYLLGTKELAPGRDPLSDDIKFWLITLVVYGHMFTDHQMSATDTAIHSFIYTFHMPLFIFISGLCSHSTDRKKYFRHIILTGITLIVFQLLYRSQGEWRSVDWYTPYWILWYLFSLMCWRTFVFFAHSFLVRHKAVCFFVAVLIACTSGFLLLGYPLSLSRTVVFFPFFLAGFYSRFDTLHHIRKMPLWPFLGIACCYLLLLRNSNIDILLIVKAAKPFSESGFGCMMAFGLRMAHLVTAAMLCICFVRIAPSLERFPALRLIGANSLFFYLFHGFFVVLFKHFVQLPPPFSGWETLLILSFGLMFGLEILRRALIKMSRI